VHVTSFRWGILANFLTAPSSRPQAEQGTGECGV
jgi:hypothetical protein